MRTGCPDGFHLFKRPDECRQIELMACVGEGMHAVIGKRDDPLFVAGSTEIDIQRFTGNLFRVFVRGLHDQLASLLQPRHLKTHIAMQFCLDAPVDGIVMSGPADRSQFEDAYQAATQKVPGEIWAEFEAEFGVGVSIP